MSKEIAIARETDSIIEKAQAIEVTDAKKAAQANEILSQLNKALDRVEEEKAKVMRPLLDATAAERARWKPLEDHLKPAILEMRSKLSKYQKEALEAAEAEAERIAARVGDGKGKFTPETAVRKIEEIDTPSASISTASGSLKFRAVETFEVIDLSKIPLEYHLADETAIRKAMKAGTKLPGVRYFTEQIPVNSR